MSPHIPAARRASFPAIADATRGGEVLIVCLDRVIRRQYQRGIAKAGGNPDNLVFIVAPGMPDDMADRVRAVNKSDMLIYDVRELATGGQG
jgi:hypothetical protein